MKILRGVWEVLKFVGRESWGLLTLSTPKWDDAANGVNVQGQGR